MRIILLLSAAALLSARPASSKTFEIDPAHSSVAFKIRHMGVTWVRGRFEKFAGTVSYDKTNPSSWATAVEIEAASVNTNQEKRDNHLRTADFFDVAKCPKLSFKSTKVEQTKDGAKLTGDLTMHCVTKPVTLDLEIGGEGSDPRMGSFLGASAHGKISRKEWGMETGAPMVGDDVDVDLDIEAKAKADAPKPAAETKKAK